MFGNGTLNVCFVPGVPLVSCDAATGRVLGGIAVDYAASALRNRSWISTCIHHTLNADALVACDVVLGKVGNLESARYGGGEGFEMAPPYLSSHVSMLYASEYHAPSGWGFLQPFDLSAWLVIWISVVGSGLAALLISRGRRMSFIRTAPTAMIGATRLYAEYDASYFQHAISVAMAIYSTVVFALYSSNLILFTFYRQGTWKKISEYVVVAPWTHEWLARRDFPVNAFERRDVVNVLTGDVDESTLELLRRGTHALLMERVVLDRICGVEPNMWIHSVSSMRTIFFPFVRPGVQGLREDLALASRNFSEMLDYEPMCANEAASSAPTGTGFHDVWGLFALMGGCVAVILSIRILNSFVMGR